MIRRSLAFAFAALALAAPARAQNPAPVVVELFTSQGCDACPPADAYLAELADRPDVIALALHVDYWDYLGWADVFARKACTARQKAYRDRMGIRMVYTPQMVVQGRGEAVGSEREQVEALIDAARAGSVPQAVSIRQAEGMLLGHLRPAAEAAGDIWIATYDREEEVEITRGENAGRTFTYHNVVESLMTLGYWPGTAPREIELPRPGGGEGIVLWLQDGAGGPISAAARMEF